MGSATPHVELQHVQMEPAARPKMLAVKISDGCNWMYEENPFGGYGMLGGWGELYLVCGREPRCVEQIGTCAEERGWEVSTTSVVLGASWSSIAS